MCVSVCEREHVCVWTSRRRCLFILNTSWDSPSHIPFFHFFFPVLIEILLHPFFHLSIPVPAFLPFFFPCRCALWVYPSFGTIPFSHSPGSQLPGPQRVDQQAGVIETSPRRQRCCSYLFIPGFLQNTATLYSSETNTHCYCCCSQK